MDLSSFYLFKGFAVSQHLKGKRQTCFYLLSFVGFEKKKKPPVASAR
jgi:hypothetical protein